MMAASPRLPPVALIFHGIGRPGREMEPGEAPYWVSTDLFEAVLDRIAALPDPGRVRITFDDGNASDHDIALPRLRARGLRAGFFVLTGRLGQPGSLDEARVRALLAAGMTVGSHGIGHRDWTGLAAADLAAELSLSRAGLEEICGAPVTEAGIPFGRYDARVLRAIRAAGYRTAWSSDGGPMDPAAFLRPRASIRGDMKPAEIETILAGNLAPLARLRRAAGMVRKRIGL